ncbi:hypothetical protein [Actinoplanes palleronii]|uniref:Integral membrane protein n=1 Tax=Actinoplanes palleronii TaxID=113570 RepID=A0ABQ4B3K5_9ACTN|nr:hypothetical protein [Actinoplanes palleronii]GIE65238.1 hypothetical protein Apa02nite_013460 [Actinoplanes palleronii]
MTVSEAPGQQVEATPAAGRPVWDVALRSAGVLISVVATVVTTLLEVELSVLRVGGVTGLFHGDAAIWTGGGALTGLAVPLTVGANLGLAWLAVTTIGRSWGIGVPWALWTLLMLGAAGTRTAEGDYLLGGDNWVALVMILAGSLSFAFYAYKMIMKPIKQG